MCGRGKTSQFSFKYKETVHFSPNEVLNCINSLKTGKSPGPDNLTAEHLKYGGRKLILVLTYFFNLFLRHNYLPSSLMDICLTPVVKDLKKDITNKGNYRPIASATAISKLFEDVLKGYIEPFLNISDNQLGFKKCSGTEMGIYLIKELIGKPKNEYHGGYVCMLDAPKAFDRINHSVLFQ